MNPKPINTEDISETKPFERFRQFAKRVISVPKKEIEKREAEYQSEKKNNGDHKVKP